MFFEQHKNKFNLPLYSHWCVELMITTYTYFRKILDRIHINMTTFICALFFGGTKKWVLNYLSSYLKFSHLKIPWHNLVPNFGVVQLKNYACGVNWKPVLQIISLDFFQNIYVSILRSQRVGKCLCRLLSKRVYLKNSIPNSIKNTKIFS